MEVNLNPLLLVVILQNNPRKINPNKDYLKKEYYHQILIPNKNIMLKGKSIGILFILLGILFLLNNFNLIEISLTELIRNYWPIILIWIGVEKLLRKTTNQDKNE